VHFIIARRSRALNRQVTQVSGEVMGRLRAYDWPGNVRELENVVERALILSPGSWLALPELLGVGAAPPGDDVESVERRHIQSVLDACDWTIEGAGRAADRLSMRPSTLRSRMKKLGIVRPSRLPLPGPPRGVGTGTPRPAR
jgi:DNA-binding NtrC family response regulator